MRTIYADVSHNDGQIVCGRWVCNAKAWAERIAEFSIEYYKLYQQRAELAKQYAQSWDEEIGRKLYWIDRDLKFYDREIRIDTAQLSN